MDKPTASTEETKEANAAEEEVKATTAGSKRDAPASETATADEPPMKRPMPTATSSPGTTSKPNGPPLLPMDFSDPDTKKPEPKTAADPEAAPAKPADPAPTPSPSQPAAAAQKATTPTTAPAPTPPSAAKASAKATSSTRKPSAVTAAAAAAGASSTPMQPKASSTSRGSSSKKSKEEGGGGNKSLKGLRHFSMMVCKKVEEKGITTYNEVADELVKKVIEDRRKEDPNGKFDEKNIRRRVYDSINVLLAMDIIAKDKKQISWKGLPSSAQHDLQLLEREEQFRKEQVQHKRRALQEILVQQICFRNLVTHNKEREAETLHAEKVPLPFIVVNSHKEAIIHCNMAPNLNDVMFEFDRPFEINDDNSILTRLGMQKTTVQTLGEMIPEDLVTYCQEHGLLDTVLGEGGDPSTPVLQSVGSNKGQYFMSLE